MASHPFDDGGSPPPDSGSQDGSGDVISPAQAPSAEAGASTASQPLDDGGSPPPDSGSQDGSGDVIAPAQAPSVESGASMASHPLDDGSSPPPESGSHAGSRDVIVPTQAPSVEAGSSSAVDDDAKFGFQRPDLGKDPLVGTVQLYDRHLFLCYKSPEAWPSKVEGSESEILPRLLMEEIKKWGSTIDKKIHFTICEGMDGTDFADGDVLIFPDMIRYRGLTHLEVEQFVDEVLKKNTEWFRRTPERLSGSFVFVCSHRSRDKRCGVCGPALILRFKEEISSRGLQGQVFVRPCSHIGGHKYAGNVIIFSPNANGETTGHWYGYVTPDHVPILLEQHIGEGKIVEHLWRGQMGLSEDDQKTAQQSRLELSRGLDHNTCNEVTEVTDGVGGCCQGIDNATCCQGTGNATCCQGTGNATCCQGTGNATCCQGMQETQKVESHNEEESRDTAGKGSDKDDIVSGSERSSTWKLCTVPNWFKRWGGEDTSYAALGVVVAAASVAFAYSHYSKKHG